MFARYAAEVAGKRTAQTVDVVSEQKGFELRSHAERALVERGSLEWNRSAPSFRTRGDVEAKWAEDVQRLYANRCVTEALQQWYSQRTVEPDQTRFRVLEATGQDSIVMASEDGLFVVKAWHPCKLPQWSVSSSDASKIVLYSMTNEEASARLRHEYVVGRVVGLLNSPFFARMYHAYDAPVPALAVGAITGEWSCVLHPSEKTAKARATPSVVSLLAPELAPMLPPEEDSKTAIFKRRRQFESLTLEGLKARPSTLHIVYERVPGRTLNDLLGDVASTPLTVERVLGLTLQLLFALAEAEAAVGFKHGDLHGRNIMVRPSAGGATVLPFHFQGRTYLVRHPAPEHVVLIDYGFGKVEIGDTVLPVESFATASTDLSHVAEDDGLLDVALQARRSQWSRADCNRILCWQEVLGSDTDRPVSHALAEVLRRRDELFVSKDSVVFATPEELKRIDIGSILPRGELPLTQDFGSARVIMARWFGMSETKTAAAPLLDAVSLKEDPEASPADAQDVVDTVVLPALVQLYPTCKLARGRSLSFAENAVALRPVLKQLVLCYEDELKAVRTTADDACTVHAWKGQVPRKLELGSSTARFLAVYGARTFFRLLKFLLHRVVFVVIRDAHVCSDAFSLDDDGKDHVPGWRFLWLEMVNRLHACKGLIVEDETVPLDWVRRFDLFQRIPLLSRVHVHACVSDVSDLPRGMRALMPRDGMVNLMLSARGDGRQVPVDVAVDDALPPDVTELLLSVHRARFAAWPAGDAPLSLFVDVLGSGAVSMPAVDDDESATRARRRLTSLTLSSSAGKKLRDVDLRRILQANTRVQHLRVDARSDAEISADVLRACPLSLRTLVLHEDANVPPITANQWVAFFRSESRCVHALPEPADTRMWSDALVELLCRRSGAELRKLSLFGVARDALTARTVDALDRHSRSGLQTVELQTRGKEYKETWAKPMQELARTDRFPVLSRVSLLGTLLQGVWSEDLVPLIAAVNKAQLQTWSIEIDAATLKLLQALDVAVQVDAVDTSEGRARISFGKGVVSVKNH